LLAHPGEDLHVLTLLATTNGPGPEQAVAAAQAAGELTATRPGDAGVLLDAQAKAAYRQRLQELRSDLANAQAAGDTQGAQRVEEEIDFLTGELTRAVGLGGRDRRAGSTIERSRINVTKAIKAALRSVAAANPSLGHHLAACIRTGAYCSYRMDPAVLVRWEL
jgi:hypothetical protein